MCLTAPKEGSLKVATEPVKVYKVITEDSKAPFYTSYVYHQGMNIATGRQMISDCPEYIIIKSEPWVIIEGGFLHACTDYDVACHIRNECNYLCDAYNAQPRNCHVVEMYIPAGTKYYEFMGEVASPVLEWKQAPDPHQ